MITKRIIPCLDVHDGRVVKGVNFVNLVDAGDPVEIAAAYDQAGADELVFLDITASSDNRATKVELVRRVAEKVFIPFTVGGGIRTVEDFKAILREGADKVAVNSAAIMNPSLAQNIMTKKQVGEERVYSAYTSILLFITKEVRTGTQAGQEAGADAEAMEGCSLLACFP